MSRRAQMLLFVAVMVTVFAFNDARVSAQEPSIPSQWIDVSATTLSFDELVTRAKSAASSEEFWFGYTFALRDGVHINCNNGRGRHISFDSVDMHFDADGEAPSATVCDDDFGLFLRFDASTSEVADARLMSLRRAENRLDETVVWAGARPANDSVAWLRPAVLEQVRGGLRAVGADAVETRESMLSAVAVHAAAEAPAVVLAALEPAQPAGLRESAVFWVAQTGGDEGLEKLIALARRDDDKEVRQQSIFWLAQVAGKRATQHLAEIAEDDPDTEVRQAAVFALSQTEDDAAIDALIKIVRTHDNREVVKSALFWLGQSGDARALALIEELLFGRRR